MKHVDLEKFANGAFSAQVNRAIEEVTENIQNPNTDAGATRKINFNNFDGRSYDQEMYMRLIEKQMERKQCQQRRT